MKRLVLLRHAKSSWKEPFAADIDRPLNNRGKRDAPEMGRRLRKYGFRPDFVVASPARRAQRTARIVAGELGIPKEEVQIDAGIYEAGVPDLLSVVRRIPDGSAHAMLVGHNPGCTDFLNFLTAGRVANIPTCGVAVIDLDVGGWGKVARGAGRLAHYDFPKSGKSSA